MSFKIRSIQNHFPEEGKTYLFDANVWKYILISPQNPSEYEIAYIDFFDAIINLSSNEKCKLKPKIYINGLILSEVYNALMRAYFEAFKSDPRNALIKFKEYRSTSDYNAHLVSIKSDLRAYLPYLSLGSDLIHSPEQALFDMPAFSDYNDHYYYLIAKSLDFSIVTNDSDFKYIGIEILTNHSGLLKLS